MRLQTRIRPVTPLFNGWPGIVKHSPKINCSWIFILKAYLKVQSIFCSLFIYFWTINFLKKIFEISLVLGAVYWKKSSILFTAMGYVYIYIYIYTHSYIYPFMYVINLNISFTTLILKTLISYIKKNTD